MLVTAMLHSKVNADLPATSSLKIIDLWLLFAMFIPFLGIILHTAIAWIKENHDLSIAVKKAVVDDRIVTDREVLLNPLTSKWCFSCTCNWVIAFFNGKAFSTFPLKIARSK